MNTTICDAETSELADILGPHIAWWLKEKCHWAEPLEYRDRAIWVITTSWCMSELLPSWTIGQNPPYDVEFHEDCPWQPD